MSMGEYIRGYNAFALAQSDTVADINGPFDAIFTGSGGNIKITNMAGQSVVLAGAAPGVVLPVNATRVWSTGTVATGVVGLKVPGMG